MNPSPIGPLNATAIIDAYEALRAAVLSSQVSPFAYQSMQRVIAEGVYGWIITLNGMPSDEPARTSVAYSSGFTNTCNESDAIVGLIASMTLQSLTEERYECV